ncbi:hypothetical protein C8R44DRAFT_649417, partial [Mycena epipterygia]
LTPLDLLNLARISKSFHSFLMIKNNAFVWKASRAMVGLPPSLSGFSEPQYAYLAFVTVCHGCNKAYQVIIWQFRARYCKTCLAARSVYLSSSCLRANLNSEGRSGAGCTSV